MNKQTQEKGFTLIEVLVVLAVVGILIAIGGPSMQEILAMNKVSSAGSTIVVGLKQARQQAMGQASPTTVTITNTGMSTTVANGTVGARSLDFPAGLTVGQKLVYTFAPDGIPTACPCTTTIDLGGKAQKTVSVAVLGQATMD